MHTLGFISGMPGHMEIILIIFIILLLFGAKKLPELSRSLGKSLGEFKKGKEDIEREIHDVQTQMHEEATSPEPEPAGEEQPEKEPNAPSVDD